MAGEMRWVQLRAGWIDHGPCLAVRVGRCVFGLGWGYDVEVPLSWRWQRVESVTKKGIALTHFAWCGFYVVTGLTPR